MEIVMAANRQRQKNRLFEADGILEQLRILIRFSKDLKFINLKSYEFAARRLEELGKILGGWIKQQKLVPIKE